jgi:hypothetical protein
MNVWPRADVSILLPRFTKDSLASHKPCFIVDRQPSGSRLDRCVCNPTEGMNDSECNQGSAGARAAAAAAARVSTASSGAAPASASSAVGSNNNSNKRKDNPAAPARPAPTTMTASDGAAGAAKKAKAAGADAIKKEIRELLEKKLMGAATADDDDGKAKLEALRTLHEYWDYDPYTSNTKYKAYRSATIESDGCHLILIALRQELDKGDGANREVVEESIRFLQLWNCFEVELGDTMLRFDGVEAVARAMKAFPQDHCIQNVAVACFHNFTYGAAAARPHALVEAGCLPLILQALPAIGFYEKGPMGAVMTLGRMCEFAGPRHFEGLVDTAVLGTLVDVCRAYNEDSDERVRASCRAVMNKLLA